MKIISSAEEMRTFSKECMRENKTVALVPTMGALHAGHLSLIDIARKNADVVVVSVFVNPTQFGPNEDFANYPRRPEEDFEACRSRGVDAVFAPPASEIYRPDASTYISEEQISQNLCGKSRPKHFRGVTTVVGILFNIIRPNKAVFGLKDAQQVAVIRRMVRDLFFDVEIIEAPIVRENSGLALSSRNAYLDPGEREGAKRIYESLLKGKALAEEGCTNVDRIKALVINSVSCAKIRVIYVEVVDRLTSLPVQVAERGKSRISIAVWYGRVRLIDNIEI